MCVEEVGGKRKEGEGKDVGERERKREGRKKRRKGGKQREKGESEGKEGGRRRQGAPARRGHLFCSLVS